MTVVPPQGTRGPGFLAGENYSAGSADRHTRWLTPRWLIDALGPFDLDPAGCPGWKTARRSYCPERGQDGITKPWTGRVWLNPPYGKQILPFCARMAEHNNGIMLVFARTETEWFHEHIWPQATALLFPRGRIKFVRFPDLEASPSNPGAPSVLVAYGAENAVALRDSGIEGCYVRLRR